jgi:hypothetical protein
VCVCVCMYTINKLVVDCRPVLYFSIYKGYSHKSQWRFRNKFNHYYLYTFLESHSQIDTCICASIYAMKPYFKLLSTFFANRFYVRPCLLSLSYLLDNPLPRSIGLLCHGYNCLCSLTKP